MVADRKMLSGFPGVGEEGDNSDTEQQETARLLQQQNRKKKKSGGFQAVASSV
jgi:hypothetical protein